MSKLEADFALAFGALAGDEHPYEREHRFAPPRRYRFDFAWLAQRVAVELEGGAYSHAKAGRHLRPAGFQSDCEKYNLAVQLGWRVLRFTGRDIRERPVQCVELVISLLKQGD